MGVGASQGAAHRGSVASRQVVGIYLKSTTECIFCLIPSKQCIGVSAPRNTTAGVRTGQVFHADIASRGQPWTVLSPPITSRSNPSKGTSGFAALRLAQYHTKKSKSNDWLTNSRNEYCTHTARAGICQCSDARRVWRFPSRVYVLLWSPIKQCLKPARSRVLHHIRARYR